MRSFETTGTSLGLLHSSFFYLYAAFQIPAGLLTDRYGVRAIATAGTAAMSLGALTVGLAPTYALAFLGRLLVGLGGDVLFVAALRFCANWFRPDEFGTMTGVTFSVGLFSAGWRRRRPGDPPPRASDGAAQCSDWGRSESRSQSGSVFSHDSPSDAGLPPIDDVPDRTGRDLGRGAEAIRLRRDPRARDLAVGRHALFMTGIGITIFGLWDSLSRSDPRHFRDGSVGLPPCPETSGDRPPTLFGPGSRTGRGTGPGSSSSRPSFSG